MCLNLISSKSLQMQQKKTLTGPCIRDPRLGTLEGRDPRLGTREGQDPRLEPERAETLG